MGPSQQSFGRSAGKNEPLFWVKQQDSFFQALEHGADAAAKIGRGARRVAHLCAQQAQLGLDGGELGRSIVIVHFRDGLAVTDEVDALRDAAQVARDEARQQIDE